MKKKGHGKGLDNEMRDGEEVEVEPWLNEL